VRFTTQEHVITFEAVLLERSIPSQTDVGSELQPDSARACRIGEYQADMQSGYAE
jgi:hypothetical protein